VWIVVSWGTQLVQRPLKGSIQYAIVIINYAQSVHKVFLMYTLGTLYLNFTIKCASKMLGSPFKHAERSAEKQNYRPLQFSLLVSTNI
jgi:hypothetical protein